MIVQTVLEFAKAKGFMQTASSVRINVNGYPFVTFIDAQNIAENIYFSKDASTKVKAGDIVDKAMLTEHQIAEVANEAGEIRHKLIGNSDRVSLEALFA